MMLRESADVWLRSIAGATDGLATASTDPRKQIDEQEEQDGNQSTSENILPIRRLDLSLGVKLFI